MKKYRNRSEFIESNLSNLSKGEPEYIMQSFLYTG